MIDSSQVIFHQGPPLHWRSLILIGI